MEPPYPSSARVRPATILLIGALAGMTAAPFAAENHAHVVQHGETLIGIGAALLQDPADWRKIRRLNRVANPKRLRPGTTLGIPLELMKREAVDAQVTAVQGDVFADGRLLAAGDRLRHGSELVSADGGFATLTLVDGSRLILQPRSRLKIEEMTRTRDGLATHTRLKLDGGRVESDVATTSPGRPRYRVTTPTAAIGVRGTSFRVGTDGSASRAEVTRGVVSAASVTSADSAVVEAGYGIVVREDGRLPKPIALLPAPDLAGLPEVQERPVVRFAVPALADARQYRFRIGTDAKMDNTLAEVLATVPEAKFADLPDGDYVVRVRGIDANGLEGRDADRPFRLKARPEPPFAISPIDGAKRRGETVALAWAENTEAARYRIQIAADATFSRPLVDIDGVAGATLTPGTHLAAGDYFWRARSIRADGDAGPWGDPQRFTLKPPPAEPSPPTLGEQTIDFAWTGEPGQTFLFQFARDPEFHDLVAERYLDTPATTLPRPQMGSYWLRVRATDEDGMVGPFTRPQRVEIPPPPPPWWLWLLPLLALTI